MLRMSFLLNLLISKKKSKKSLFFNTKLQQTQDDLDIKIDSNNH